MVGFIDSYMKGSSKQVYTDLDAFAEEIEEHSFTMSMLLLLLCGEPLLDLYHMAEISEDIYIDSMKDLTCKLVECYELHGIWGTFVSDWYPRFYTMDRFALGRLQYEFSTFGLEDTLINGNLIKKGDKVLNMHIPSSGSFSTKVRMHSYKKAYEFYEKDFGGKPIPFVCNSWLLYPKYQDILPERSNILGFCKDFAYIHERTEDDFHNAWRIFGKDYKKDPKEWPRDTSLRKLFAEYVECGGTSGNGYGVFLFDGQTFL